jgi:HEAT repeat protein
MRYLSLFFLRGVTDLRDTSAIEVIAQLGTARVGAWRQMRRLQHGQTETERREAAQKLRDTRTVLAVDELILALDDPSLHVREEAAEALGEIGDTRAVEALIQRLDDPASGITDEAALSLGKIGDERAVEPLLRLFKSGEKMERVAAARALGMIGSRESVDALVQVVEAGEERESDEVIETAVGALGAIGDPKAVPALVRCLENAQRTLKLTAIRALGEIGDRRAAEPLLKMLRQEEDPALIAHMAVALAMIGEERAARPLLEAISRVESPVARKQILNAVGALMGEGEMFYPLLALESYARDEAVSRLLQELARRERTRGQERFSALRRQRQFEQIREYFVSGDFTTATQLLARIASATEQRPDDSAKSEVVEWAAVTSQQREMQQEEFLLALFAVRSLLSR